MKLPFEITTFASDIKTIKAAMNAGADHIILEDSKLSIRSFHDDFNVDNFNKISQLANEARSIKKDVKLSFNLDILVHEEHYDLIDELITELKIANINRIRVQDAGLIPLLLDRIDNAQICLATETGNNNVESSKFYSDSGAIRQSLGNELPANEIKDITDSVDCEFELQVHGRVLLQYSRRMLLSNIFKDSKGPIKRYGKDTTRPEHCFALYENIHGHFTYHSLDKSLFNEIPTLLSLNLSSWLIDLRGENIETLKLAIQCFKEETLKVLDGSNEVAKKKFEALQDLSQRKLSPLFFKHNPTNQTGPQLKKVIHDKLVGKTVDIVKPTSMVLKLTTILKKGDSIDILTPDGRTLSTTLHSIRSIWDEDLEDSQDHDLIKLPWLKGAVPQSLVVKR